MTPADVLKVYSNRFPGILSPTMVKKASPLIEGFLKDLGYTIVVEILEKAMEDNEGLPRSAMGLFLERCADIRMIDAYHRRIQKARRWKLDESDILWLSSCGISKTVHRKNKVKRVLTTKS